MHPARGAAGVTGACGWPATQSPRFGHGVAMREPLRAAELLRVADESDARGSVMRRAARRGDLRQVRRGAYIGTDRWAGLEPDERHVLEVRAALAAVRTSAVASHRSAAALWGLPVVGMRERRVHLTFVGGSGADSRGAFARHAAAGPLPEREVDGIRVTSVARTVVDLARMGGFLTGVAAGDAALHRRLATLDELRAEVEAAGSGRGVRQARDVVAFVDQGGESPGESLSRVRMRDLGLPMPVLQHEVRDHQGFVGRVDFWWEELGVIGEFDGRSKYGVDGVVRSATDQLWDEKIREDRLRAAGARVVRWTWADAWLGAPMAARLAQAGVRGGWSARRAQSP